MRRRGSEVRRLGTSLSHCDQCGVDPVTAAARWCESGLIVLDLELRY